jgi:hypothetical protein
MLVLLFVPAQKHLSVGATAQNLPSIVGVSVCNLSISLQIHVLCVHDSIKYKFTLK